MSFEQNVNEASHSHLLGGGRQADEFPAVD